MMEARIKMSNESLTKTNKIDLTSWDLHKNFRACPFLVLLSYTTFQKGERSIDGLLIVDQNPEYVSKNGKVISQDPVYGCSLINPGFIGGIHPEEGLDKEVLSEYCTGNFRECDIYKRFNS